MPCALTHGPRVIRVEMFDRHVGYSSLMLVRVTKVIRNRVVFLIITKRPANWRQLGGHGARRCLYNIMNVVKVFLVLRVTQVIWYTAVAD